MFKTRLLSGILLVIIALITLITGGNLLFLVLLAISLIGLMELYRVFAIEKKAPGIVGYVFAVLYYALLYFKPILPGDTLDWFMMLFLGHLICLAIAFLCLGKLIFAPADNSAGMASEMNSPIFALFGIF